MTSPRWSLLGALLVGSLFLSAAVGPATMI